ncbi:MAG TPA: sensor histidine kinase [Candidatus Dormibacteraeota bacterium]|jgi:signal transduction histidine kinase|nr:sensor histidine kinase [Candidatus Dormibacteraeota bacterium]
MRLASRRERIDALHVAHRPSVAFVDVAAYNSTRSGEAQDEMQARATSPSWIAGRVWRACSALALAAALLVIAGREVEAPDLMRLPLVASFTALLAAGWLAATLRFTRWAIAVLAAGSLGLIALGHFLSGSAGITAVVLALALDLEVRRAAIAATALGIAGTAVLGLSLGPAVPAVHAVFVAAFWTLAFLLGRYVRFAENAKRVAEQLLVLTESVREERERTATLQERARIARDVHDILADTLSALVVQLERARVSSTRDAAATAERIADAQRLARRGLREVGTATATLRGDAAPGLAMLPRLAHDFEQQTGTPCRLTIAAGSDTLTSEVQAALYRALQEALTNVRKHSVSRRVDVRLRCPPGRVELVVDNDGEPLLARAEPRDANGHGLEGMRERAALLGGELETTTTRNGFSVRLTLPRR